MTPKNDATFAKDEAPAHPGLNRRKLLLAGAWATPVLVATVSASSVAASGPTGATVEIVRAGTGGFTKWEGTNAKAPGFRFFNKSNVSVTANITFTPSGGGTVAAVADIFNVYDGLTVLGPVSSGGSYIFTVVIGPLGEAGHVGITLKQNAKAMGIYWVTFSNTSTTLAVRNQNGVYEAQSPAPVTP